MLPVRLSDSARTSSIKELLWQVLTPTLWIYCLLIMFMLHAWWSVPVWIRITLGKLATLMQLFKFLAFSRLHRSTASDRFLFWFWRQTSVSRNIRSRSSVVAGKLDAETLPTSWLGDQQRAELSVKIQNVNINIMTVRFWKENFLDGPVLSLISVSEMNLIL